MLGGKWQSFYKANKVNSWEEEINLFFGGGGRNMVRLHEDKSLSNRADEQKSLNSMNVN